jgi:biopolymer transport protein ExbD
MAHRRKLFGETRVEVPITPMLDMTFQLLFYFILNYNPSALEGQMDIVLPTPKDMVQAADKPSKSSDAPGPEEPPEEPPEVTVVVKTQNDGTNNGLISAVGVQTNSGETNIATPNGQLNLLVDHLKKLRETLGNKNDIKVQGDSRLKWESIVRVRDACQRAGFVNASFAPPPDLGMAQ